MKFRRQSKRVSYSSYRVVARIILLAAICVAGATLLKWNSLTLAPKRQLNPDSALPPSPFADVGQNVFVAQSTDAAGAAEGSGSAEQSAFEIDSDLLARVLDKTKGIPGRPYFHLVDIADRASIDELRQNAVGEDQINYAVLYNQPDQYRGDTILLKGHLRELVKFRLSDDKSINPSGKSVLYQGALVTDASQPYSYIIIVPDVPGDISLGTNISEEVTFAGFFLKLWRYRSASDVDRAAPLLIGRLVAWTPSPETSPGFRRSRTVPLVVMSAILGVGALIWFGRYLKSRLTKEITADDVDPSIIRKSLANLEQNYDTPPLFPGLDHTKPTDGEGRL